MYETKLAHSIQSDYRHAADNHRLVQTNDPVRNRVRRIQSVALIGTLFAALFIFL